VNISNGHWEFISNACADEVAYLGQPRINFINASTIALQSLEGVGSGKLDPTQTSEPRFHRITGFDTSF